MENYVKIGKIVRPFGIKGEVKVQLFTDFPLERFKAKQSLLLVGPTTSKHYTVASFRLHQDHGLCLFNEVDSVEFAETLRQHTIWIDHELVLATDAITFYHLKGCKVWMEQTYLGEVIEVLDMPAHPVLRVKNQDKVVLVPYVDAWLDVVDIKEKKIILKEMVGL